MDIDESDTFQYLWTIFAHVLNQSTPLDLQLVIRTPDGADRKIFGKLDDVDVKMGLPARAVSFSSPTPTPTSTSTSSTTPNNSAS